MRHSGVFITLVYCTNETNLTNQLRIIIRAQCWFHRCGSVSASDFVEFSNYMSRDRKYQRHCGQLKEFDVASDRKFFRVTFKSNDRYDGTGFNASYVFVDEEGNFTTKPPTSNASTLKGKTKLLLPPTFVPFHTWIFTFPTHNACCFFSFPFFIPFGLISVYGETEMEFLKY